MRSIRCPKRDVPSASINKTCSHHPVCLSRGMYILKNTNCCEMICLYLFLCRGIGSHVQCIWTSRGQIAPPGMSCFIGLRANIVTPMPRRTDAVTMVHAGLSLVCTRFQPAHTDEETRSLIPFPYASLMHISIIAARHAAARSHFWSVFISAEVCHGHQKTNTPTSRTTCTVCNISSTCVQCLNGTDLGRCGFQHVICVEPIQTLPVQMLVNGILHLGSDMNVGYRYNFNKLLWTVQRNGLSSHSYTN